MPRSHRFSPLIRVSILAVLLSLSGTWTGAAIHVAPPPMGSDVSGDGTGSLPFATIQHAYHQATLQGETIMVEPGHYVECIDATGDLVDIGGGVLEPKWINLVAAGDDPAATTIQCNGVLTTVKIGGFGGTLEGFTITGGGDSGVLGVGTVTITGNVVTGNSGDEGGGISTKPESCIYGETLTTITDNIVTSNSATVDGGGMFVFTGQDLGGCQAADTLAIVQGNTVENNLSLDDGGGLEADAESELGFVAAITIEDNVFRNNSTVGTSGFGGGARALAFGDGTDRITIRDNLFESNVSSADGGGLSAWIDARTEADHIVLVEYNTAIGNETQFVGGGIDLYLYVRHLIPDQAYSMIARRNTVIGNFAYGAPSGGGLLAEYELEETLEADMAVAEMKVTENLIQNNSADLHGGGLALGTYVNTAGIGYPICIYPSLPGSATIEATHNLVIENYAEGQGASDGGGLVVDLEGCTNGTATASVAFNTIAANEAIKDAGGIMVFAKTRPDLGGRTELDLHHNIVSDNNEYGIKGPEDNPGIFDLIIEYNNFYNNAKGNYRNEIGDRTGQDGNVSVDPLYVDPAGPDYHLSPGSEVIDLGSPHPGGLPPIDFDGNPRFVDGDGDGQTAADMGYDEYFVCVDVDADGFGELIEPGDTCTLDNCLEEYNPNQIDCDGDGLGDACDPDTVDTDGDGVDELCDPDDTDPNACADTDSDGCDDCSSGSYDPYNDGIDLDRDGICAAGDSDEGNPYACADIDGDSCDDCTNGSSDLLNDGADFDGDGACDDGDLDDDDDGVEDGDDNDPFDQNVCRDVDGDTCDDCTNGSSDPADDGPDFDGDGDCDNGDLDDDDDGVDDAEDTDPLDSFVCRDVDADLCDDCSSGTDDPSSDGADFDLDGLCDLGDPDDDDDGVADGEDADPFDDTVCRDADGDTCDDCSRGPVTYFEVNFDADEAGFAYLDDAFRGTSEPDYADGVRIDPGGFAGGGLSVSLGGMDDLFVFGISGGWQRSFSLEAPGEVVVSLYYNLTQSADYEPDELSQALLSVDDVLYGEAPDDFLAEIAGDGNGGAPMTTGWQYFDVNLGTLSAGSHTLTLGGFNNWKSFNNETTDVRFDNVAVFQTLGGTRDNPSNDGDDFDADGLCDAGDPDDDNDGADDTSDSEPFNPFACGDTDADTCDDCTSGAFDPANDGDDLDTDGLCDAGDPDDDNDSVDDVDDEQPLNPNACRDTDTDTCDDCSSGTDDPNDDGDDFDGDGACDDGDLDDDNDNVDDVDDDDPLNPNACRDTDTDTCDDCSSGTDDPADDGDDFDTDGLCDAGDPDDDNDNVDDVDDSEPLNPDACRDADADTCDDCSSGIDAPGDDGDDFDSDGLCDLGDPDDDNDNVDDGDDGEPFNANACRDTDADTCDDCSSGIDNPAADGDDFDSDGACDAGDLDDDNDNVDDVDDQEPLNATACRDTDADTCDDCSSGIDAPADDGDDFDTDGLCDAGDPDDDNDNVDDLDDDEPFNANACRDTDGDTCDDCSSGVDNADDDGDDFDTDGLCDAGDPDDDNDNVDDGDDDEPLNPNACRDADADTCDDCVSGVDAPGDDGDDFDTDGLCDAGDPDDDNDTVDDIDDGEPLNPNACRDLDADLCDDCSSGTDAPGNDGTDFDTDGLCDLGDPDDDNDGVDDGEDTEPFNPLVCGDVDGDSCEDCITGTFDPADDGDDFDTDGLCDAGDPDDDNDGVLDPSDCAPFTRHIGPQPGPIGATLYLSNETGTGLVWSRGRYGPTANVYRGTIAPGVGWTYDESCLEAEIPGTELTNPDTDVPPPGEAFYYLVAANNACGESRIGVTSEGTDIFALPSCPAQDLDSDDDGVPDVEDTCPLTPDDTLADLDLDFVGDVCDNCSSSFNPDQADADLDGPGDACDTCTDLDDDGLGDPGFPANTCDLDNCPVLPNSGQENDDGDSHGNVCDTCPDDAQDDIDGDGLCADVDNCDALANPDQFDADTDGEGDACDDCTDLDDDGYGDPGFPANTCDLDNCPVLPNSGQENDDGDANGNDCDVCPGDANDDLDNDGICAGSGFNDPKVGQGDNCPGTPNPNQDNLDGDSLGDLCDPCFANPDPACLACADPDTDQDGDGACNLDVPLTTFGPSGDIVAIEFGSNMTYLANSTDPLLGMTWAAEDFDDSGWADGVYGIGFERTSGAENLILTPVPTDSVSAYTRTTFFVADVSAVGQLFVGADYDDAYVVWVNGAEVYRSPHIPAGPLDWDTVPGGLHESSNGATPDYGSLNDISATGIPALHVGDNVLAVAVWSPDGSSDMVLVPRLSWITESDMSYLANEVDPEIGLDWTELLFNDSNWGVGTYGIGYDTGGQAADLINTEVPVGSYSAYTRVEFDIPDLGQVGMFTIGADYDDGYIAWVNGVEIYRSPEMIPGDSAWNARPTSQKDPSNGTVPDYGPLVNVSDVALPALQQGSNVLAIGVYNVSPTSSDLVLVPRAAINGATWDNCPDDANPGQEDTDGDGIGDACETQGAPLTRPTSAGGPSGRVEINWR